MSQLYSSNQIPDSVLKYVPQYKEFDAKARQQAKIRFTEHVQCRRGKIVQCMDRPLSEINNLGLTFTQNVPQFIDDNEIEINALKAIDRALKKWNGVQISSQFKASYNKSKQPMNWKKFSQIAKNHQDQTSWKISGNFFFAPYIAKTRRFFNDYIKCILNINESLKNEIFDLLCLYYVVELLETKIKFRRTKLKPLLRYKTLVMSKYIHHEFYLLSNQLKIKQFIQKAKKKRKQQVGKVHIIAEDFYNNVLQCSKNLLQLKKDSVYKLLNKTPAAAVVPGPVSVSLSVNNNSNILPADLLDSDYNDDDDDDMNNIYNRKFQYERFDNIRDKIQLKQKENRKKQINNTLNHVRDQYHNNGDGGDGNGNGDDVDMDINVNNVNNDINDEDQARINTLEEQNNILRNELNELRNLMDTAFGNQNNINTNLPPFIQPPIYRQQQQQQQYAYVQPFLPIPALNNNINLTLPRTDSGSDLFFDEYSMPGLYNHINYSNSNDTLLINTTNY